MKKYEKGGKGSLCACMMDNTMKRILKTLVGMLFLLSGIALFFYPEYREWKNQQAIQKIQNDFQERLEDETDEQEMEPDLSKLHNEFLNYNYRLIHEGQTIKDAWEITQSQIDMDSLNQGSEIIGYLEIPDISLSLPLYLGASEGNMANGAVVLAETSMPVGGENTNCVIAAHRGWGGSPYFRDIDKLRTGSVICIVNPWEKLFYQVTGTAVVHETDCGILNIQPGKDMVTLFSCYPYGVVGTDYRLAIFCERTRKKDCVSETEDITNTETELTVHELIEKDLNDKEVDVPEYLTQKVFEHEDMLRRWLPVFMLSMILLIRIICFLSKRKRK